MPTDLTRVLFEALDRLAGVNNSKDIVEALRESVQAIAQSDGAAVLLREGASLRLLETGSFEALLDGQCFRLESCIAGRAMRLHQAVFVENMAADLPVCLSDPICAGATSMAVVPIRLADPIGVIRVWWNEPRSNDPVLLQALQTLANASAISLENARLTGWVEVAYRSAQQEARKYTNLLNTMDGVVWEAEPGTLKHTFVSSQAGRLLGYTPPAWLECDTFWLDHVHPDDRQWAAEFRNRPGKPGDRRRFEYRMIAADGRTVWVSDYLSVDQGKDDELLVHGVMVDVSEQKSLESQVARHALYDPLTGLPNRSLLLDHAEKALRPADGRAELAAILFIDLDGFKHINDSFGHLAGDALLMAVASRLRKASLHSEITSRVSGDQFAVLVPDVGSPGKARSAAERFQAVFARPFNIGEQSLYLTASIGIATSHEVGSSPRDLLREANTALCRARHAGRAHIEFFDVSMHEDAMSRLRLETDLRLAAARHEFEMHYQPIVSLEKGQVLGFEALLRWPHPERGMLLPGSFLTAAADIGIMNEIGFDAISQACATMHRWRANRKGFPWVSVNLSPHQLAAPGLDDHIRETLDASALEPRDLKLEITEDGLVQVETAVTRRLASLHNLGVGILIDDFGSGMSSFGRLRDAPVDTIKIDRRFVEEIEGPHSAAPLLRSIISLGRNLHMDLIAEGVETAAQIAGLRDLGCDAAQGFYFAHAVPAECTESWFD